MPTGMSGAASAAARVVRIGSTPATPKPEVADAFQSGVPGLAGCPHAAWTR